MQNTYSKIIPMLGIAPYVLIGILASFLFSWFTQSYVDLFGETYTPNSKLLASLTSLVLCLVLIFSINRISLKLNSRWLGISVAMLMFLCLYIVGPGVRAPVTLYITLVSFPYNVNMLAVVLLPWIFGSMMHRCSNQ